jgi:hypothetical protein
MLREALTGQPPFATLRLLESLTPEQLEGRLREHFGPEGSAAVMVLPEVAR